MTPILRPLAAAAAALTGVALTVRAQPPEPPRELPPAATATSVAKARMVGTSGCAAMSCHGADVPKGSVGGEHHTFGNYDPHRNAFRVLHQERSKRMVRLLAEGDGAKTHPPAHQTALCLKCHGAAASNVDAHPAPTDAVHQSGSCENCHGAAGLWGNQHYLPFWKTLSAEQKAAEYGLHDTKNLAKRAGVCAGCHIGEPGREVDHRLIAAGHPVLRWEFAAGHAEPLYTKHWTDKGYGPDLEAWTWIIGQAAGARASAQLLAHRADQSASKSVKRDWPELAEYACYSCHQDLVPAAFRAAKPRVGSLPWGSWYYPLARELPAVGRPASGDAKLNELADLFAQSDRPNPATAAAAARDAVAALDARLAELQKGAERGAASPLPPATLRAALGHVAASATKLPDDGATGAEWDRATQSVLGAAALYRALIAVEPAARDARSEELFRELAAGLRFEPGRDGPSRPTPAGPAKMRAAWDELRRRLGTGG